MITYNKETTGLKKFIVIITELCILIAIASILWVVFILFQFFILQDLSYNLSVSGVLLSVCFAFLIMGYGFVKIDWDTEFNKEWWN